MYLISGLANWTEDYSSISRMGWSEDQLMPLNYSFLIFCSWPVVSLSGITHLLKVQIYNNVFLSLKHKGAGTNFLPSSLFDIHMYDNVLPDISDQRNGVWFNSLSRCSYVLELDTDIHLHVVF